eukprot:4074961-Prymnesium_polylepis.1
MAQPCNRNPIARGGACIPPCGIHDAHRDEVTAAPGALNLSTPRDFGHWPPSDGHMCAVARPCRVPNPDLTSDKCGTQAHCERLSRQLQTPLARPPHAPARGACAMTEPPQLTD